MSLEVQMQFIGSNGRPFWSPVGAVSTSERGFAEYAARGLAEHGILVGPGDVHPVPHARVVSGGEVVYEAKNDAARAAFDERMSRQRARRDPLDTATKAARNRMGK